MQNRKEGIKIKDNEETIVIKGLTDEKVVLFSSHSNPFFTLVTAKIFPKVENCLLDVLESFFIRLCFPSLPPPPLSNRH